MSILREIISHKREEVKEAKSKVPISRLEADLAAREDGMRGLKSALSRGDDDAIHVLAEIKRASPSAGPIWAGADPAQVAEAYQAGGAAAISVLTDRRFFDGRLEFLGRARQACKLPLLRKDFLIDPYQSLEAAAAGADGALLIVAALEGRQLAELIAATRELGLDALVEVHSEAEAERALIEGATLLGVNHRDLATFEIDMSLTGRIAKEIPQGLGVVLVAESGIKTTGDLVEMEAAGAHAALIGERLMAGGKPEESLAELLERA